MNYVELKSAMKKAEERCGLRELDFPTRELLHTIAHENSEYDTVRFSDLKELNSNGSGPTLLTRLNRLVDGGWIVRRQDKQDKRVVLLKISPKARSAFQKISKALERSSR